MSDLVSMGSGLLSIPVYGFIFGLNKSVLFAFYAFTLVVECLSIGANIQQTYIVKTTLKIVTTKRRV